MLGPLERARANSFRVIADGDDFVASRVMLRIAATLLTGEPIHGHVIHQDRCSCGRYHCAPTFVNLPGLHTSLSHTAQASAAVVSWEPAGIDIENVDKGTITGGLAERFLSPRELAYMNKRHGDLSRAAAQRELLSKWTTKEALVKIGVVTLDGLRSIDLPNRFPAVRDTGCAAPYKLLGYHVRSFDDRLDGIVGSIITSHLTATISVKLDQGRAQITAPPAQGDKTSFMPVTVPLIGSRVMQLALANCNG